MARAPKLPAHWTDKERAFAKAYIRHGNGARAVREAGYDVDEAAVDQQAKMAYQLLARPHIRMWVERVREELRARYEITEENILRHVAAQAFGSIEDFLDENGKITPEALVGKGSMALLAVQSIEVTPSEWGDKVKLALKPSLPALEKLATRFKLFVETTEVNVHMAQRDRITEARRRAMMEIEHDDAGAEDDLGAVPSQGDLGPGEA